MSLIDYKVKEGSWNYQRWNYQIINHYTDFFTNKTSEHGTMDSLSELLAFLVNF